MSLLNIFKTARYKQNETKKLTTLVMAGIISRSLLTGCGSSTSDVDNESEKLKVAMITDVAGVNDHSFNQSAWEGLQKAKEDSDYSTNVETLIDEEVDLIIGVGSKLSATIEQAAKDYL